LNPGKSQKIDTVDLMVMRYLDPEVINTCEKDEDEFLKLYRHKRPIKKNISQEISGHFINEL
jgi:hypothetical protein